MEPRKTISLSASRAEQLRMIAGHHEVAVTEMIERWIAKELVELGQPTSAPPDFFLDRTLTDDLETVIMLKTDRLKLTAFRLEEVLEVASELVRISTERGVAPYLLDCTKLGGRIIEVRRQGRGIVLAIDGRRKGMTLAVARDLGLALKRFATEPAEALMSQRASAIIASDKELAEALEPNW